MLGEVKAYGPRVPWLSFDKRKRKREIMPWQRLMEASLQSGAMLADKDLEPFQFCSSEHQFLTHALVFAILFMF